MKYRVTLKVATLAALVCFCFQLNTPAQTPNSDSKEIASMSSAGSSVRWDLRASHAGGTLTVAAPDGRIFTREIKSGSSPDFALTDNDGVRLPDGQYTYELRLSPVLSKAARAAMAVARGKDDEPESVRASRKRVSDQSLVQSGSFTIMNGAVSVPGQVEETGSKATSNYGGPLKPSNTTAAAVLKYRQHHPMLMPDQVIPDDLIVQGSACVGLDCVNNENFGFDTIRMKENNTRIQFDDTSVSAGFATNNWQIRANAQGSGGGSFLAFVDQGATGNSETGTIVFEVDAGAPANSLRVSSTGRVGIRTATPVLDLHANSSDTPAIRLEQNNTGGFTAQTWDIAGNEANFFVRDVTSGSRLPFRIRPGAPTSSLDISATGNVGINTGSPGTTLDVVGLIRSRGTGGGLVVTRRDTSADAWQWYSAAGLLTLFDYVTTQDRIAFTSTGRVGIGTNAPDQTLTVNGEASKPGGGTWAVFSDERLKNLKGKFTSGLKAVMQLQPLRYEYLRDNALGIKSPGEHIGFQAQAVEKVIPEAVIRNDQGYLLVNNDPILWTMLNAIKEQQQEIAELKREVKKLRAASRKRR